ncbi:MAG: hypothetical protein V4541_02015 [Bacteroidota bacterium]
MITFIEPQQPAICYGQVSGLYFNDFLQQNVIRKANLLNVDFWVTYLGKAAAITWRYDINYKYFTPPFVNAVSTAQGEYTHHQAVSAWDIGHVSW